MKTKSRLIYGVLVGKGLITDSGVGGMGVAVTIMTGNGVATGGVRLENAPTKVIITRA